MSLTRKNRLLKRYLEAEYVSEDGFRFVPIESRPSNIGFLASRGIMTWAILGIEKNESEAWFMKRKLKFCKLTSSIPGASYLVYNISLKEALRMGKDFELEAIIFGDETGEGELKWIEDTREVTAEKILLNRVKGCIHRDECTTGCPQREVRVLELNKIEVGEASKILDKWARQGIPTELLDEDEDIFPTLWRRDLRYKEHVLKLLERRQK